MRQPGEPTVEEILESIKQVIARDNRDGAAEQRRQRESEGVAREEGRADDSDEDGEILDLSEADALLEEAGEEGDGNAPLVTEDARVSMRDSLAALAMLAEPGARPQIVRSGETSLEGLVRDLLRPALADWLDKNLPPLVERMVATEIARIVGKKG